MECGGIRVGVIRAAAVGRVREGEGEGEGGKVDGWMDGRMGG